MFAVYFKFTYSAEFKAQQRLDKKTSLSETPIDFTSCILPVVIKIKVIASLCLLLFSSNKRRILLQ